MTDNDIIKALECCCKGDKKDCFECPLQNSWDCHKELREKALDLINRKDAEIERLQNESIERIRKTTKMVYEKEIAEAKTEAIKEFAERLKAKGDRYAWVVGISKDEINNLVKEMTENDFKTGDEK